MISVFTPAYNRANELKKLYNSLINQSFRDFEWVIVDDGSTDNTMEVVSDFIKENLININYYKQENGGKSLAHNKGVELAKGEFFVGIDSDDYFTNNALEIINKYFQIIESNDDLAGICFLNYKDGTSEIIGTEFPQNEMIETYYNIYNKHNVTGDKEMVFKTKILKEYLFPIFPGEKFVPEALLFNRICKKYKFLCVNEAVIYKKYLEEGYSSNYLELAKKNANAHMVYYKELYEFEPKLYNVAAYIMYGLYANKKFHDIIKEHPARLKAVIMYIPAFIKYKQKGK